MVRNKTRTVASVSGGGGVIDFLNRVSKIIREMSFTLHELASHQFSKIKLSPSKKKKHMHFLSLLEEKKKKIIIMIIGRRIEKINLKFFL